MPTTLTLGRLFLHLGSLLSDAFRFCQADVKLSSTVCINLSLLKQVSSLHPSNIFFYFLIPWDLIALIMNLLSVVRIFPLREGETKQWLSPPYKVPMTNQSWISSIAPWGYLQSIGKGLDGNADNPEAVTLNHKPWQALFSRRIVWRKHCMW